MTGEVQRSQGPIALTIVVPHPSAAKAQRSPRSSAVLLMPVRSRRQPVRSDSRALNAPEARTRHALPPGRLAWARGITSSPSSRKQRFPPVVSRTGDVRWRPSPSGFVCRHQLGRSHPRPWGAVLSIALATFCWASVRGSRVTETLIPDASTGPSLRLIGFSTRLATTRSARANSVAPSSTIHQSKRITWSCQRYCSKFIA